MDQTELVQQAVFSLEQAAQRIETLAGQSRTPALTEHLRRVARLLAEQARALAAQPGR